MQIKKIFVGLAILALGVVVFVLDRRTESCDTRACKLGWLMPRVATIQNQIEATLKATPSTAVSTKIEGKQLGKEKHLDIGYIDIDGTIVIVEKESQMIVIAKPTKAGGEVTWECRGFPEQINKLNLVKDCGKQFR